MDLKKLIRMPVVLVLALLMVLMVSSLALAAPSEKGTENGGGRDKKAAEQDAADEETTGEDTTDEQSSRSEASGQDTSQRSSNRRSDRQPPEEEPAAGSTSDNGQGCDGSHGSDTGHGANTDGPDNEYHNTCDGTASDNGNDRGGASGRPCAGCVGNADDKNPPGQARNGDDANNGYECDGNNGVGGKKSNPTPAGNPAHTGCRRPPVDVCTVNCVPPPTCPPGDTSCTPPTCPPGSTNAGCVPPTCPDGSQMLPNGKCNENKPPKLCPDGTPMPPDGTCVRGIIIEKDKNPGVPDIVRNVRIQGSPEEVSPQVEPQGAVLPFTGGDLLPLLTLAMVLMAVGALTLRRPQLSVGSAETSQEARPSMSGATVQLPSGKSFTLPLRRTL